MKLRSISATGLKGPDFSHQLSEATAIIGPNAAGKTRIVQGIRLTLEGWLRECGKTPRATWELASGPELTSEIRFDNDDRISRRLWLDGSTVKIASHRDGPGSPDEFAELPLLNAEAYFELTDSKRTEYVFERIKLPDTYTPAAIVAECERISFEEAHSEQIQKAKGELVRDVEEAFEGKIGNRKATIQESLSDALETFRERFTYWNSRAKATQGAVTTLAELKLREKTVAAAARGVDAVIRKAQDELDALNTKKGQIIAKQDEVERTAGRIKALRKQLDADRIDYQRLIQKLMDGIKELGRAQPELEPKAREHLVEAIRDSRETMAKVNAGVEQANKQIEAIEIKLADLDEMAGCPFCKASQEGWQSQVRTVFREQIAKLIESSREGVSLVEGLDKGLEKMEATLFESDASAKLNSANRLAIESKAAMIERHKLDHTSEVARRVEWQSDLDDLELLPKEMDLTKQIDELSSNASEIREQISVLQGRKDAETRLQQQLVSAAQAEIEHIDAAAHVTVIKSIAKLLKEKREAMIEEAFGGLLKIANQVTDGILRRPLSIHEGTIGMWDTAKFIPHRVFSGTEKALAYIAIAVALSSTAPLKLVILDEYGRLDEGNQLAVTRRLLQCIEEKIIDQFIIVGTSLPKGVTMGYGLPPGARVEVIEV